jgi:putative endonuclease
MPLAAFQSRNLIGTTHPEFKDLAESWGWKRIREHEEMYP